MMFHLNSSLSGGKIKKNHSVKEVNREGYLYVRGGYIREISLPPSQFFCKPKTSLKQALLNVKKKKGIVQWRNLENVNQNMFNSIGNGTSRYYVTFKCIEKK